MIAQLKNYIKKRNDSIVNVDELEKVVLHKEEKDCLKRKIKLLHARNYSLVKSKVKGKIVRSQQFANEVVLEYYLHYEYLMKSKENQFHLEEEVQHRKAKFVDGELFSDEEVVTFMEDTPILIRDTENTEVKRQFQYDRREAVRYAERWWNDYNPKYRKFENNCTNFVSQCLRAGGAPMTGYPNRSKGWWYQNNNWSYSWSVAHAFRWYLSGAKSGLRGQEVSSPEQLMLGDVICYDFDGDGRFQHTTIVVAKDANNMPLVNAQTFNSRMRYWAYEDSTAWTPNIQYKFFHIVSS